MKTRVLILAGGEGTRLGVLTAKRTKPAVPFAGKYRIIDFTLSNCVNSQLFDVMIVAQYRPHSLIEHIGAGGPWDLNRDFTGGIRIYTPYKSPGSSWFVGTADAVQQNFSFIKRGDPDLILILSGDHIYSMDYSGMIRFHMEKNADLTMATIQLPIEEAPRFGIVGTNPDQRVISFVEKPKQPPSTLANMGVYLFNKSFLGRILWEDHLRQDSSHDFGKDILPAVVSAGERVYAYPFTGYWVDVGTVLSYWKAHMDLLDPDPPFNLHNRSWIIHTRSEERPPVKIHKGAEIENSMICDGCVIERGARVIRSVLSPGVHIQQNATVYESIILTDAIIESGAKLEHAILDKRARIGEQAIFGKVTADQPTITMIGKNSVVAPKMVVEAGAMIATDVIPPDYPAQIVKSGEYIQTRRLPYEL